MTKDTANRILSSILLALDESVTGEAPESYLWLPIQTRLGIHLDDWNLLMLVARDDLGLVTVDGSHLVRITTKGRGVAEKVRKAMTSTHCEEC